VIAVTADQTRMALFVLEMFQARRHSGRREWADVCGCAVFFLSPQV
jgi:hypothetical protein